MITPGDVVAVLVIALVAGAVGIAIGMLVIAPRVSRLADRAEGPADDQPVDDQPVDDQPTADDRHAADDRAAADQPTEEQGDRADDRDVAN